MAVSFEAAASQHVSQGENPAALVGLESGVDDHKSSALFLLYSMIWNCV
jgi:hypothetical protein